MKSYDIWDLLQYSGGEGTDGGDDIAQLAMGLWLLALDVYLGIHYIILSASECI